MSTFTILNSNKMDTFPKPLILETALHLSYSDIEQFVRTCKSFSWILTDRNFWHLKVQRQTDNYRCFKMYGKEQYVKHIKLNPSCDDLRLEYVKLMAFQHKTYIPGMEKFEKDDEIRIRALRSKNTKVYFQMLNQLKTWQTLNYQTDIYLAIKYNIQEIILELGRKEKVSNFAKMLGFARTCQVNKFKDVFNKFLLQDMTLLQDLTNQIQSMREVLSKVAKGETEFGSPEKCGALFKWVFSKFKFLHQSFDMKNYNREECYHEMGDLAFTHEHNRPADMLVSAMEAVASCKQHEASSNKYQMSNMIQQMALQTHVVGYDLMDIYNTGLKSAAKSGDINMVKHFIAMGATDFEYALFPSCKITHLHILEFLLDQPSIFEEARSSSTSSSTLSPVRRSIWNPKSVVSSTCDYGCLEAMDIIFRRMDSFNLLTTEIFKSAISTCVCERFKKLFNWICSQVKVYLSLDDLKDILRFNITTGINYGSVRKQIRSQIWSIRQAQSEGFYTGPIPVRPPKEPLTFPFGCSSPPSEADLAFSNQIKSKFWF